MSLTFEEYVTKYQGEKNPGGTYWTAQEVAAATASDEKTLQQWGEYYQAKAFSIWSASGKYPSDEEVIALWKAEHPEPVVVQVSGPTAPYVAGQPDPSAGLLIKARVADLLAAIEALIVKHKS